MSENKSDCKYWDKCYQKNPAHHEKYNHPTDIATSTTRTEDSSAETHHKEDKNKRSSSPKEMEQNAKKQKLNNGDNKNSESSKHHQESSSRTDSIQEFIKHNFLVEMPSDFYEFWKFCNLKGEKNKKNPKEILKSLGLCLVGPFDFLSDDNINKKNISSDSYLCHWRFYYDPPEFQTVFVKSKTSIHYGYWRDEPKENEKLLMARNDANKGCKFEFIGGNCFETVIYFLDNDCTVTPFNKKQIADMKKLITNYAEANNISLTSLSEMEKVRNKKIVCRTFHRAGIVVPYDYKTQCGYRPLIESDTKLKSIISAIEKDKSKDALDNVFELLQPIITAANIATDECDFGTPIELGIDLFCSGHKEFHNIIEDLLTSGYSNLHRTEFISIIKSHLNDRKKDNNLSILN